MSALHEKLQRLKQKQAEIEKQLAAQAAAENAIVAKAFGLLLTTSSNAYRLAETSSALNSLSTRERSTFNEWLARIEPPAQKQPEPQAQGNHFGSTESKSGLPE